MGYDMSSPPTSPGMASSNTYALALKKPKAIIENTSIDIDVTQRDQHGAFLPSKDLLSSNFEDSPAEL